MTQTAAEPPVIEGLDPDLYVDVDLSSADLKADPAAHIYAIGHSSRNPMSIIHGRPHVVSCRHGELA